MLVHVSLPALTQSSVDDALFDGFEALIDDFYPLSFSLGESVLKDAVDQESWHMFEHQWVSIPEEVIDAKQCIELVIISIDREDILHGDCKIISDNLRPPICEVSDVIFTSLLESGLGLEAEEHVVIEQACAVDFFMLLAPVFQEEEGLVDLVHVIVHHYWEGSHLQIDLVHDQGVDIIYVDPLIREKVKDIDRLVVFLIRDLCDDCFTARAHKVENNLHW